MYNTAEVNLSPPANEWPVGGQVIAHFPPTITCDVTSLTPQRY